MAVTNEEIMKDVQNALIKLSNARNLLDRNFILQTDRGLQGVNDCLVNLYRKLEIDLAIENESNKDKGVSETSGS